MRVDGLYYDGGTYQSFLKIVSYKDGWDHKVREYTWEKIYDFENRKPKIEDIAVYVLGDGGVTPMFQYCYTKKRVIER